MHMATWRRSHEGHLKYARGRYIYVALSTYLASVGFPVGVGGGKMARHHADFWDIIWLTYKHGP